MRPPDGSSSLSTRSRIVKTAGGQPLARHVTKNRAPRRRIVEVEGRGSN